MNKERIFRAAFKRKTTLFDIYIKNSKEKFIPLEDKDIGVLQEKVEKLFKELYVYLNDHITPAPAEITNLGKQEIIFYTENKIKGG